MRNCCLRFGLAIAVAMSATIVSAEVVKNVRARSMDDANADMSDVLAVVGVKVGEELTQENLSRDVKSLLDSSRYSAACAEVVKVDGGVDVVYVVRRRLRYQEPLAITGAKELSERKINKVSALQNGDYVDEPIVAKAAQAIKAEYQKNHYPDALVDFKIEPEGDSGFCKISFDVKEGERRKVVRYAFDGNASVDVKELRASFGDRPWYDPRGWFVDAPLTDLALEDARRAAEEVYHKKGYLDARIDFPVENKLGDGKSEMVFKVAEGDIYSVESTKVRGVTLFPAAELDRVANAALPTESVAGSDTLDAASRAICDYYGDRGYVDTQAKISRETIPGRPGRLALTFDIREGVRAKIGKIIIRGNTVTKDKVIRREIMVSPGDDYNATKVSRSQRRVKHLGYFEDVRFYTEKTGEEGVRDLVYEVDEKRTGSFMVGVGFSSVDNVIGFLEVQQSNFDILNWPNFTGGGQKARAGIELGDRRQTAEVEWSEPWLFDRPMALTVEAHRRLRWYDDYDEVRTGASVGLSYPVRIGRIGMRYTLEQVDMDDVDGGSWYSNPSGDGDSTPGGAKDNKYFKWQEDQYGGNLESVGRIYWTVDTRNNAFVPTKGVLSSVFGEMSEGGLGDNEFWHVGVNYKQWWTMPWGRHVFSLRGRYETVDAYSGDLPIYDRLFLGGPRTVRGAEYRDIGPKVFRGGDHAPIGGKSMLLITPEYTIPLFKAVRFALFSDIGSLSEDEFDADFSNVYMSVGCGLRIDIPGFPIRLDFAKAISEDDDYTDDEVFSFMIGFE